jgi:16S rRNA (cytosine967-C5)-methyltransferase
MQRWVTRYGEDAALRWAENNQQPAPTSIVVRDGNYPPQPLVDADMTLDPCYAAGERVDGSYKLQEKHGAIAKLPGFREGLFWVQDPAATAVADLVPIPEDGRVLDACGAPGGKALRLACRGAQVTAIDRSGERLALIKENAKRLRTSIKMMKHDWLRGPCPNLETFQSVLMDAPCTGLGTVRRHPEIRWRRQESDLQGCQERQMEMLSAIATHVGPNGTLVYSVCSVEPEETEEVAKHFERANPAWHREMTWSSAPPQHGEDAHFAVRWRSPA